MTYDYELKLIGVTVTGVDSIGQEVGVEIETTILCSLKSITRTEFYAAAQAGIRPSLTFVIHKFEYASEKEVEFEGQRYKVIRTYSENFDELELTCERVGANG